MKIAFDILPKHREYLNHKIYILIQVLTRREGIKEERKNESYESERKNRKEWRGKIKRWGRGKRKCWKSRKFWFFSNQGFVSQIKVWF